MCQDGTLQKQVDVIVLYQYIQNYGMNKGYGAIIDKCSATQNIVYQSIDKVLDRGERIELLVHKSDSFGDQAIKFNRHARKLKNRMFWKNVKIGNETEAIPPHNYTRSIPN